LLFYMLTIAGLFRLRWRRPDQQRPVVAWGYPWLPAIYLAGAGLIVAILVLYRPTTTWPGLALVATGLPVFAWWNRRSSGMAKKPVSPNQL